MKTSLLKNSQLVSYYATILVALLLTVYICITPNSDVFFYDSKRIAGISLVLLTFITLSSSSIAQNSLISLVFSSKRIILISILLIFTLGCLSALLSPVPKHAFIEIISLFSLLLVSIQCAQVWRRFPKTIPWLTAALLLSFSIQEVKFFSYYLAFIITKSDFSFYDFFFTFFHPRFFNQYQLWTLPLLSFVLLIDHPVLKNTRLRLLLWGLAIVWWGMFFTTNGRGVIVAVLASLIITTILFRKKAQDFLKITIVLSLLGLVFYQVLFHLIPYLIGDWSFQSVEKGPSVLGIRSTSSGRLNELWPAAVQYITDNPWLGIGPMHYSAWNGVSPNTSPHNSLLQLASEWGLPVLVIFLYLFYRAVHAWCKRFNMHTLKDNQGNLNLAIIAVTFSLCSALIYSLFSGVFIMPMSQLMSMLVISLAIALYKKNDEQVNTSNSKHNWTLTITFATCAIVYFWLISPDLIPRLVDPTFNPETSYKFSGPRFWRNNTMFN